MLPEIALRSRPLPRPLLTSLAVNVVLGLLAILALCAFIFVHHATAGELYKYFPPIASSTHNQDFVVFVYRFRYFHSPLFFSMGPMMHGEPPFEYPAPAALLYRFFYAMPWRANRVYLLFNAASILTLAWLLERAMVRRGLSPAAARGFLALSVLFSYPFWFVTALGNMEFCVFLMLAGGVIAFCRHRPYVAAVLFGTAAAMKIFPFVLVALFLSRKQYKPVCVAAGVAILLNVVGLWAVDPSVVQAYRGINAGLGVNRALYILPVRLMETAIDHSLFGLIKRIAYECQIFVMPSWVLTTYLLIAAGGGLLLYFGRIRRLPVLNQIVCLFIVAVLLPPTSHDYTLIHLYVPWALLILYTLNRVRAGQSTRDMVPVFVLFAITFSPANEFVHRHMGFSAQIKCIALIALFILALTRRWESPPFLDQRVHELPERSAESALSSL